MLRTYIEKDLVMNELTEMRNKANGIPWSKKDKILIFNDLLEYVDQLKEYDPNKEEGHPAPFAEKLVELEPFIPHGDIGHECYHCSNCKTRVKRKDKYCRGCGYRFQEEEQ